MTYSERLLDPRWQRKRLEILQRDDFTCQHCVATDKTLHVDHGYYEGGREPWEYPDYSLRTLCVDCHAQTESFRLELRKRLARLSAPSIQMVVGFVRGCDSREEDIVVDDAEVADGVAAALECDYWDVIAKLSNGVLTKESAELLRDDAIVSRQRRLLAWSQLVAEYQGEDS